MNSIRKTYQVSTDENSDNSEEVEVNSNRALKKVAVTDLDKYVNRTVYLERKDGTKFIGIMTAITWDKVSIRARLKGGYADLSVNRSDIEVAKLYPIEQ